MDSSFARIPAIVPEDEKGYPEPAKLGIIPAYGFFIRHVHGIKLNNVEVSYLGNEVRPAIMLEDVKQASFYRIKVQPVPNVKSIVVKNVEDLRIEESGDLNYKKK